MYGVTEEELGKKIRWAAGGNTSPAGLPGPLGRSTAHHSYGNGNNRKLVSPQPCCSVHTNTSPPVATAEARELVCILSPVSVRASPALLSALLG